MRVGVEGGKTGESCWDMEPGRGGQGRQEAESLTASWMGSVGHQRALGMRGGRLLNYRLKNHSGSCSGGELESRTGGGGTNAAAGSEMVEDPGDLRLF